MGMITLAIEDDQLLRRITVRAYCFDEEGREVAMMFAVKLLEVVEKFNLRIWNNGYVEPKVKLPNLIHSTVSFTVLYKSQEARNKFIDFLESGNFLWKTLDFTVNL